MIHVAEFNGGQIRLEISNQDDFIRAVKRTNREIKRKKLKGDWKIRLIGSERINAPIQQLIADLTLSSNLNETAERTGETPREILEAASAEIPTNGKPVRPRPGGPLN
jgi:hypothetical protein